MGGWGCGGWGGWGAGVFWVSVLPSIVETRDQNSRGCPLLFSNRNLRSCMCIGDRNPIHPQPLGSCGPFQE